MTGLKGGAQTVARLRRSRTLRRATLPHARPSVLGSAQGQLRPPQSGRHLTFPYGIGSLAMVDLHEAGPALQYGHQSSHGNFTWRPVLFRLPQRCAQIDPITGSAEAESDGR